jgi:hypothetical protein
MNQIYGPLHFPLGLWGATANVLVLGLVFFDHEYKAGMTLMVPNSWSLSIELFCHLMLAVWFARTPQRLLAFAVLGLAMLTWSTASCAIHPNAAGQYGPYCFQNRYGVLQAGVIPFALGGLLHFWAGRYASRCAERCRFWLSPWILPLLQFFWGRRSTPWHHSLAVSPSAS